MPHTTRLCIVLASAIVLAAGGTALAATPHATAPANEVRLVGPLGDVLDAIASAARVNISVDWDALRPTGVTRDTRVRLRARDIRLGELLRLILAQVSTRGKPLNFAVRNGRIVVSTDAVLLHGGGRATQGLADRPTPAVSVSRRTPVRATVGAASSTPRRPPTGRISPAPPRPTATARPAGRRYRFDNTALKSVVEFFRTVTGAKFHVSWRALADVGIEPDTPVSLNVSGVPAAKALELITEQLSSGQDKYNSVYWVIDEGVVHIATGTVLARTTRTRVYDVADLLMVIPRFRGPRVRTNLPDTGSNRNGGGIGDPSGGVSAGPFDDDTTAKKDGTDEEDRAAARQRLADTLIAIIRDAIGEDMWRPSGKGSIRIFQGKLIVTQSLLGFKLLDKAID